jgi:Leucine-rich repeat (LRR) protein
LKPGNQLGPEIKAETFLSVPKTLEILDISNNGIRSFENEAFRTFRKLEQVLMYENDFQEFDEKILPLSIKFIGVGELKD